MSWLKCVLTLFFSGFLATGVARADRDPPIGTFAERTITARRLAENEAVFDARGRDPARPLLLEPGLDWSTFLGGSGLNWIYALVLDDSGNVFVTGATDSRDFPTTPGAFDSVLSGGSLFLDCFVSKFNSSGDSLIFSTLLGGSNDEIPQALAVDQDGSVVVTGFTSSQDFPWTPGASDSVYGGGIWDAFVTRLDRSGSRLLASTFLGGAGDDGGRGVVLDESGNAFVAGIAGSPDFPVTPGAYDTSFNGGSDAFLAKINAPGGGLVFSSFLGGDAFDGGTCVVLDSSGLVIVGGDTRSAYFPVTSGAYDETFNNSLDAFITAFATNGATLAYSTFLGGRGDEQLNGIAARGSGGVLVAGSTGSPNFPTTPGALDRTYAGGFRGDAFVAELSDAGSGLQFATYLGGPKGDQAFDVTLDGDGNIIVVGQTFSSTFPTTPDAYDGSFNGLEAFGDCFLSQLNPSGCRLLYSGFFGGTDEDRPVAVRVVPGSAAVLAGWTLSRDLPTRPGAFDRTYNGGISGFVAKVGLPVSLLALDRSVSPDDLCLVQSPNPFRERSEISFYNPIAGAPVVLDIFDVAGRRIRRLVDGPLGRGWARTTLVSDGETEPFAPGVYILHLRAGGATVTRKLVKLR